MIEVKICGLTEPAGFDAAIAHGADWIGFVFFARSPRAIGPAAAADLSRRHPGGAGRVGLFVKPTDDAIADCLDHVRLDALQIYDDPGRAQAIRDRFGLPVWLACAVSAREDLPEETGIDRLLIESRPPGQSERPGGNGVTLDWGLLQGWNPPCSWMLAGGLDPLNVAQAIRESRATAVDVSSGVESRPGIKDPARVAAFVAAARSAEG